jgi:hypothetical protein
MLREANHKSSSGCEDIKQHPCQWLYPEDFTTQMIPVASDKLAMLEETKVAKLAKFYL